MSEIIDPNPDPFAVPIPAEEDDGKPSEDWDRFRKWKKEGNDQNYQRIDL